MAKPRVFVSSTYYDLKHLRASMDAFIESLGFEPVLSEKGDIAYAPNVALDESCYRDASSADIFVLIIGGRYGSEASSSDPRPGRDFFERYESITKKEYESAVSRGVPTYILIDGSVYSEYQTYLKNKDSKTVKYAHVDSANVFILIEEILSKPKNNPIHPFDKFSEIESWLREQWAGLFRELLRQKGQGEELATLSSRMAELREINETMRKYLEAMMTGANEAASTRLVELEQRRLHDVSVRERARENAFWRYVTDTSRGRIEFPDFLRAVQDAKSLPDFSVRLGELAEDLEVGRDIQELLRHVDGARQDFNELRKLLGVRALTQRQRQPKG